MFDFNRFKQLCRANGLSGAYIANKLGHTRSYFTDLKNGKFRLSASDLDVIAAALHTTPAYLMGETDDPGEGIKKEPSGPAAEELSEEDRAFITAFRAASPEKRRAILELLN